MQSGRTKEGNRYRHTRRLWCGLGSRTSAEGWWALSTLRYRYPGYALASIIARRASTNPISTKAEVTSGPPTRMRVGVFILFHS